MIWIQKARAADTGEPWKLFNNLNTNTSGDWTQLVGEVISIILMLAGALAIIYLIYSGIIYITAAGNPDNAKKGQQGVINAIIGIVIIALAYFIAGAALNLGQTVTGS